MLTTEIPLDDIKIDRRRLAVKQEDVQRVKKSIEEVGLLVPPLVAKLPNSRMVRLVAGLTRIEALKQLGFKAAMCQVVEDPPNPSWLAVAEIDENLARRVLSEAERARMLAERRTLAHGEPSANEIAKETGLSTSTVKRDINRGKALGVETLNKIKGTSLDSGAQMDALAKLPPARRRNLVMRAATGESVTALRGEKHSVANRIIRAWTKASRTERSEAIAHLKKIGAIT